MRAVLALLLAIPAAALESPHLKALREFLKPYPGQIYAKDFLAASDRFDLDWRLLPAICVAESTCGKHDRNNNMFGWKSGRKRFRSRRHGIWYVARQLAEGKRYKDKTCKAKLKTYNPASRRYPSRVLSFMDRIQEIRSDVKRQQ